MNERQKEQQHIDETIALIHKEQTILSQQKQELANKMEDQLKEIADKKIRGGDSEAFYESVIEYQQHEQELLIKYQTAESQEKRVKTLSTMANNPYFARIDFQEETETETLYLGIASLRDKDEETIVIDWRAPIANLYYEGELGETFYETDTDRFTVDLLLKRQFKIQNGQLQSMVDTSEIINDEFLLEILDDASSSQMRNIVSTIQKAQNQIIRDTNHRFLLIEGIAGSGKTSALLQRVAYLLYRNRKWLDEKQVLLFSPNHLFSDYISMVLPSLGESEVPTRTFHHFLQLILRGFEVTKETQQEANFLSGDDDAIEKLKSSLTLVKKIQQYVQAIAPIGPMFRDLKIQGQTYITKEQIRQWYQDTNDELPIYQRSQLLQTKLLKKVAGLEKDEAKKDWVKEEVEEQLQQAFANDPHQEYSEENERRMRKKLRQQIVRKKFRSLTRGVKQFQFINQPKQYLHFLQSVLATVQKHTDISAETWQESMLAIKQDLRQRRLKQEDAVLFFLLIKQLYPIHVEEKARFIFIDEMQDFPPAQVAMLRQLYPKAGITLCGDLNQKVYDNESIVGSLDDLFPQDSVKRYQLKTSYRSTKEITDFANQFLTGDDQVELTARGGDLPTVVTADSTAASYTLIEDKISDAVNNQQWRTAIICKTAADCQKLYQQLAPSSQDNVQLIISEEDFMKRNVMIFPAFLAKGLEFDQVIVWTPNAPFDAPQDQLIFYTMATRAMHQLTVIADQQLPILDKANPTTYQAIHQ
ncbi:RNA polymerase recycling motor HelD [Enterococcus sp. N249-2]